MKDLRGWLEEHPDYIDVLEHIAQYEKENLKPDNSLIEDTYYDTYWSASDVHIMGTRLYQLEMAGFLERVYDSNKHTDYALSDRDKIETLLGEIQFDSDGAQTVIHDFPSEDELDEIGVFDDVVGYEKAKWLMRKAMASDNIVNIVLVGPPGSGKTVFLRCIRKLKKSAFVSGKKTSEAGFTDVMFEKTPRYVCIDELDDMDSNDQETLSDYTEDGILVETKGNNKRRTLETNAKTFASANTLDSVIEQIENRFTDLHFDQYTLEEFKEVCRNILTREYDHTEESAERIADAVWEMDGYGNVRKAEDVAALSDDGDDLKKVIEVLDEYSQEDSIF